MMTALVDIQLLTFLAIVAFVLVRLRDLFTVAMLSGIFSLICAGMFVVMDAVDVAFTEASVGAGISTVLILGALSLTTSRAKHKRSISWGPFLVVAATGAALVYGTLDMPLYGDPTAPIHQHPIIGRYMYQSYRAGHFAERSRSHYASGAKRPSADVPNDVPVPHVIGGTSATSRPAPRDAATSQHAPTSRKHHLARATSSPTKGQGAPTTRAKAAPQPHRRAPAHRGHVTHKKKHGKHGKHNGHGKHDGHGKHGDIGVPNVVTSILASYRGYDTLGEVSVIFTAGIGVLLLLGGGAPRRTPGGGGIPHEDAPYPPVELEVAELERTPEEDDDDIDEEAERVSEEGANEASADTDTAESRESQSDAEEPDAGELKASVTLSDASDGDGAGNGDVGEEKAEHKVRATKTKRKKRKKGR